MTITGTNLHIYPSSFSNESRIEKLANSILKLFIFGEIHLVGTGGKGIARFRELQNGVSINLLGIENRNSGVLYKSIAFAIWYVSVIKYVHKKDIGCVNAHSLSSLPLACLIKVIKKCKLVYDTHELETETISMNGYRKNIAKLIERRLIRYVDHIFVVSDSIADWYEETYQIERPSVILNVPKYSVQRKRDLFRRKFPITENQLIAIYQGDLSYGRGIEPVLETFTSRDNDKIVLILMGDGALKSRIQEAASKNGNIFYHEFVSTNEVANYTSSADIGISLIENSCLSYYYCLPNKLFEYAMSGLPVIVSNMHEMQRFVSIHEFGVVSTGSDSTAFGLALDKLIQSDLRAYGRNARTVAEKYSWEVQERVLGEVYKSMFSDSESVKL